MTNEQAWNYAIGLIKVDGLEPSEDFLEYIEREKAGELTIQDLKDFFDKKYNVYVSKMEKPVMPSQLPKGNFDFRGAIAYAKEKGVTVPELTDKEKDMFFQFEADLK